MIAREAATKTTKDKTKVAENAKKRATAAEKAKVLAEKRYVELETKLNEANLKLAEVVSLNVAQVEELADLRAALEACEDKWYNEGFADAKNSMEPVIKEAWRLAFEEGWLAALQALGVPEDSPLRDPSQIAFPSPTPTVQNPLKPIDEKETQSMREMVEQIDSHVELMRWKPLISPMLAISPAKTFRFSVLQTSSQPRLPPKRSLQTLQSNCQTEFLPFTFIFLFLRYSLSFS